MLKGDILNSTYKTLSLFLCLKSFKVKYLINLQKKGFFNINFNLKFQLTCA